MTDQNNNINNNELNEINNSISIGDQNKETIPNTSNKDLEIAVTHEDQNIPLEYSKKLQIGNTKLLIVDKEEDVISGGEAPNCCVFGSPDHVAALKAKIDELKSNSEQLERERKEALVRSESVSNQLDRLVEELSQLGHDNNNSKNGEHTIHATIHTFGPLQQNLEIIEDSDSSEDEHKYDRIMRQPKIRQYWHNDNLHREAEERRVSFTELFWDLIFVAVIGNLGHDLVEDISGVNIERFILTFYPIYKIWLDMTIYMNFYSTEDLFEKFFLLFEMILVITMGTHATDIFDSTVSIYLVSYVIARMAFMILHILHAVWIPLFRTSFVNTAWGVFIPCIIWIVAIFVPSNRVTIAMWIAIAFENLWFGLMPLYVRFGRRLFYKIDTKEEIVVDTTHEKGIPVNDPSSPTSPVSSVLPLTITQTSTTTSHSPHKAMRTRGTEYQWKWKDLFSIFKLSEYRPALNIEHYKNLWFGLMPLYVRFGRRLFYKIDTKEEIVVDTTHEKGIPVNDPSSPTSPVSSVLPLTITQTSTTTSHSPHKAMRTRGTEYQWKWKDLFSIFKLSEYRPALNIEHYSERLGLFAIIALGEGVLGVLYTSLNPRPDGQLGKAILGLLITYNLHWIYFIVDGSKQFQHALRRHVFTGLLFGLVHFPLNMALIAFGASLEKIVQLRDFPGAQNIPVSSHALVAEFYAESISSPSESTTSSSESTSMGEVDSHIDSHNDPLSWLYCVTLAISLYCMGVIGVLHKGLDDDDYLRIPKMYRISLRFIIGTICLLLPLSKGNSLNMVAITSMLSLLLVIVETYGRLRKGLPLFGKCEDDIMPHSEYKRYVRWKWGNKNLSKKNLSTGILRKRKSEKKSVNDTNNIILGE
ncbi:hypothetical protein RclHR1_01210008 [Rhizophagus clarus]|uniref:Uncharacterized protein n=1 Tax=Rhizophagus clarus TaxID=94130 RepID=A0A2Z6Q692_9GLOM|nr:hypothetical protein RclHR1_01210008 [Rhizophagus clarus]